MSRPLEPPPSKVTEFDGQWIRWLFNLYQHVKPSVKAGYGGAFQSADITPFDIPSTTFITLPYDTLRPANSIDFSVDLVSESFNFGSTGAWKLSIGFNIAGITELNQSRVFGVELYNTTDSVVVANAVSPVSRNQGDVFFSTTVMFDISPSQVGKTLIIRMGGTSDSIAGGTLIAANIAVNRVSEV